MPVMSIKSHHVLYLTIGVSLLFISISTLHYWQKMLMLQTQRVKSSRTIGLVNQTETSRPEKTKQAQNTSSASRLTKDGTPTPITTSAPVVRAPEPTETQKEIAPDQTVFSPSPTPLLRYGEPVISPGITEEPAQTQKDSLMSVRKEKELLNSLLPLKIGL